MEVQKLTALDEYRLLGNSGLRVSPLCLGTMTFGTDWGWGADQEESRRVFERYIELGGNFIDTANIYTNGTSETFVGEFIQSRRELRCTRHQVLKQHAQRRSKCGGQPPQEYDSGD